MDFSFTPQQEALREEVLNMARRDLASGVVSRDRAGEFDRQAWQKIADAGLLGANVPESYGGRGYDTVTAVAMLEALGEGCPDNGLTLAVSGQMWAIQDPIVSYGTEEQKQVYLPGLTQGELLGAHAMTEPGSGSDTFALETTAQPTTDGYVINGFKTYIGLGPISDVALVFAKTDPDKGKWGISAFLVPTSLPGITLSDPIEKMGLRTSPLGSLTFEDVEVPRNSLLGTEGAGAAMFNEMMEWERSFILAGHVGSMARQLAETVEFARSRKQFGRPIGDFPVGLQPHRRHEGAAGGLPTSAVQDRLDEDRGCSRHSRISDRQPLHRRVLCAVESRCDPHSWCNRLPERARDRTRLARRGGRCHLLGHL